MRAWLLIVGVFISHVATATDYYVLPAGAGQKDGTSWDNALQQSVLNDVVNTVMQPGDRLLIGSGIYSDAALRISKSGSAQAPITIAGVDGGNGLPIFESAWKVDKPDKGQTAIRIESGASHLVLEGLRIRKYMTGVLIPKAANCTHITFNDVDMEHVRHGFYVSDCDNLRLNGCDLKRYTKHGFRFEQGCDQVELRNCTADCSAGDADWETKTELFPFGFLVNNGGDANTEFLFVDCLAANNIMPLQKTKYKNGDGFVVEANTSQVSFIRCRALRNQDGGFDLKVSDVQLTSCIALYNSRNIRIWSSATLSNCFSGWASAGLWCNGGPVTVNRSTLHELRSAAVQTDDNASQPVTLNNCLVSSCPNVHRKTARGQVVLNGTEVLDDTSTRQPAYVDPVAGWNGLGPNFDSRAYPTKGFQSPNRGDLAD